MKLSECPRAGQPNIPYTDPNYWGNENCRAFEHAGVVCSITAPDAPTRLEAAPKEQSMITLRWRAPNSYVEGYKIEVSEDGVNNWTDLEDDTENTDTTYTHSGLSPGDTRHYRVSAINTEGTSDPSNIADATIPGPVGNRAPGFSAASATRSVAENTLAGVNIGVPVTATDLDNDTLSYSLEGLDAASFDIVSSSGQLKTKVVPNYETKSSYSVTVKATDPSNASDTITVTISVTNVDESGTVTFSYPAPFQVNEVLTATLSDPDGSISGETWIWERSLNQNSGWTVIPGATSASYTLVVADEDHYLRATATYTDAVFGSGKTAQAVSTKVPNLNWPPEFGISPPTFSVPENSAAGVEIGTPVTAADQEMDPLTYSLDDTDGASFDIESSTGQIKTKAPLDYETKDSYSVTVTARDRPVDDPEVQSDTITVTINVTNEEEPGEVTLSSVHPQVGTELTATLEDPDGSVSGKTWKWYKSSDLPSQNNWTEIPGATSASYTPVTADEGDFLRATVTYTDRHGSDQTAHGVSDTTVTEEPVSNNAPVFDEGDSATRSVDENAARVNVGAPVGAMDQDLSDAGRLTYLLGGTHAASFSIDNTSGQIKTRSPLNYESRSSYSVTVTVRDPSDATDTIKVTINVTDVDEPAIVNLYPPQPRVGSAVTTRLTEYDGSMNNVRWEWHRSLDKSSGSWSEISGVTVGIYTPVADDVGYYLRATAFYDDPHGPQSPEAVSDNPVRAASSTRTNNPVTKFTPAVPHAPSGLTAVRGDAQVTLNWRAPNDGGSAIKYYEYNVDGGAWISTRGKSTSYTVTGLEIPTNSGYARKISADKCYARYDSERAA